MSSIPGQGSWEKGKDAPLAPSTTDEGKAALSKPEIRFLRPRKPNGTAGTALLTNWTNLSPSDTLSHMNTVVEVRPGEGGEDAEQFAEELTSALSRALSRESVQHEVQNPRLVIRG
ncbi:PCRF domain-containing protein, partial [Bradyrhizobium sp. NBAIM08]|uniref:PCRF domain-containing protein n=1 Tax=Bradyrhizobium sp. NBAIM08 TaxID=2793815 RepID=UPI001CD72B8C